MQVQPSPGNHPDRPPFRAGAPPAPGRDRRRTTLLSTVAATAALVAGYALFTLAPAAHAAPTLLSQNRPVTASSTENAAFPAGNAVDGNTGTRWSSAFSDPQWLRVDLGANATIESVTLNWEAAYATAYQLQVSTDGNTWSTVYSTTAGTGGVQTRAVTGTGRYVRMYGTARATQYGYSLWEFQVYGTLTSGGCGTANVALGRPATASSTESTAFPAGNAVDGNTGTRWSSAFSDPQWLRVDLGAVQPVCQVVLRWEAAYATAFQIQVSTDAAAWSTVYSTGSGTGGTQTLAVSGSGRYVRMYGTARATQYGYSLWEFAVHAGSGPSPTPSPTPTPSPPPGGDVLLSYGRPATASSAQNDGACPNCVPGKAVDSDPATRWATSAWSDPGWISVDLGATATVHSVVLQWDPAYATAYQIQVSANASTWTTIWSTSSGRGFRETVTGLSGTGRYVRMYGTARVGGYGYSLWEFQVYGTGGSPTPPPAPAPDVSFPATRLVFSDEFNGAAGTTPDSSKWTPETGPGVNNELQYYTSNRNAAMDGAGNLVLEARREVTAGSTCPRDPLSGSTTCQYTSARLNTAGKFAFSYGRVEARIKVSGTQGLWPAFWLLGANFPTVGWPACGEIDIMEHLGREPALTHATIHAPAYFGAGGIGAQYQISGDFAAGFHVFAVEWNAAQMTFLVDGNAFLTLTKSTVESTRGPWVYDHPFFIIINNAVGGDWPGAPDASTVFPQRMSIDYIRVYQ